MTTDLKAAAALVYAERDLAGAIKNPPKSDVRQLWADAAERIDQVERTAAGGMKGYPLLTDRPMVGNAVGDLVKVEETGLIYRWDGDSWEEFDDPIMAAAAQAEADRELAETARAGAEAAEAAAAGVVAGAGEALAGITQGEIGGYTLSIKRVRGYEMAFVREVADGRHYVVAGKRKDGSWMPGAEAGGQRTCYHIVGIGQSNRAADASTPVISTAPTGWGNKRFARGENTHVLGENNADPENRADAGFAFVNLTLSGVETRAVGLADTLKMLLTGRSRHLPPVADGDYILISSTATGSRRLSDIGPLDSRGEGQFITMVDDIRRGKASAEARGDRYVLLGCDLDQGEREGDLKLLEAGSTLTTSALISGYRDEAIAFAEAFDAAAQDVTGEPGPFLTFVTPASSNALTPEGWAQAAAQCDLIRIVGGRGSFQSALHNNRSDTAQGVHFSPDSHRTDIGERVARAIHAEIFQAEGHRPPVAIGAEKLSSTTIRIDFDSRFPLEIDTATLPPALDLGVTLRGGTVDSPGAAVRATALEVVGGGHSLIATLPSVPAGALLGIGQNSLTGVAVPLAASVSAATNDPIDSGSRYTVAVAGDLREALKPLTDLGHFILHGTGTATSQGVIRWVEYTGGQTLMTGRVAERRTGGSYVAFEAGQTLQVGHTTSFTNIRDRSPARARTAYQQGERAGRYPDMHNWTISRTGIPVKGA